MILDEKEAFLGTRRNSTMLAALNKRSARLALAASLGLLTMYIILYKPSGVVPASFSAPRIPEFPMEILDSYTVADDAHRTAYADDFFGHPLKDENGRYQNGHFDNVTALPKITLAEAKAACQWDNISRVNFAFGEESGWGIDLSWVKHDRKEPELAKYRNLIHRFIHDKDQALAYYDNYADRFTGRGIVIVGGQGRSLKRVRVILRQLKRLGCKLPVELHYWGAEMDSSARIELATMWHDITFNNIAAPNNIIGSTYNRAHGIHYHLKVAALINARFEDILLLDSDNIPVINPEELFDSPTYQEYGTVFWPDIQRTRRNNPIYPITNTECTSTHEWELESGQLMVNKKKFFYHLQLAAWFIDPRVEHSSYWLNLMLGDKDTFRYAWHALKTRYGTPRKWITSVGTLNNGYYCGHTFAQHHPDNGKVAFLHGGLLKTMRKEVVTWQKEANGGVFQAYKRDPYDENKMSNPKVGIKWDGQDYLPNRPKDMEIQWCTDFEEVEARPFDEIVPNFTDADFESIGGYWMLNETSKFSITDGNL